MVMSIKLQFLIVYYNSVTDTERSTKILRLKKKKKEEI